MHLRDNIQELAYIATKHIETRAIVLKRTGIYTAEQAGKDKALIHFFNNWAAAESQYWTDDRVPSGFFKRFISKFPWFKERKNGVLFRFD